VEEARKESAGLELNAKAVALGLTVKEYENSKNSHRTTVKAAIEHFVSDAKKTKKRTTAAEYERNLRQFENSLRGVRFLDEITKRTLEDFRDFLAAEQYEPRTLHNRLLLVLIRLKANGIKIGFSLVRDLPHYEEEPAVPYEPDVVMPLLNGLDAARQLKKKMPDVKIVFLTMNDDSELATEAMRAGASAYLLKSSAGSELFHAIEEALRGRPYVTKSIARAMQESFIRDPRPRLHATVLTSRQREVIQLLAEGKSMKKVGGLLNLKLRTVAFHKYRVMQEMGFKNNADLVKYAVKNNIVAP